MKTLIFVLTILAATTSQAATRAGRASFGGILVKITADTDRGVLQIGESVFQAPPQATHEGLVMTGVALAPIMTWTETLVARLYLDGGNGGDPVEYNCENARLKITRFDGKGKVTEIKNECVYLFAADQEKE